jgi:hypothetical protein
VDIGGNWNFHKKLGLQLIFFLDKYTNYWHI